MLAFEHGFGCIGELQSLVVRQIHTEQALQLTDAAKAVLKGEQSLWLRPLKRDKKSGFAAPATAVLRTEREERLWQALRTWRKQRATQDNVPAYVVFPDRTLQNLVEAAPQSLADLDGIYGMGSSKIDKYGAEVVALCQDIAAEHSEGVLSSASGL